MGESYASVWVPAFAVAHILAFGLFVYALEQISGAVTYLTWHLKYQLYLKRKFHGNFELAWVKTYPGAKQAKQQQTRLGDDQQSQPADGEIKEVCSARLCREISGLLSPHVP